MNSAKTPTDFEHYANGYAVKNALMQFKIELEKSPEIAFAASFCGFTAHCAHANIRLEISDSTEPNPSTHKVLCSDERFRHPITRAFAFELSAGRIPESQITDWLEVTKISVGTLQFARLGPRRLIFTMSIVNSETLSTLATASFMMIYENPQPGYIDLADNENKARRLGATIALTIASAQCRLTQTHTDTVLTWLSQNDPQTRKDIGQIVKNCNRHENIDLNCIRSQLLQLAGAATCLEILDLCLKLCPASSESIAAINTLAHELKIDHEAYLAMLSQKLGDKALTPQLMLGIVPEMDEQTICHILNDEYRRWNGRVTSFDPAIRSRAMQRIDIITQARESCCQPIMA